MWHSSGETAPDRRGARERERECSWVHIQSLDRGLGLLTCLEGIRKLGENYCLCRLEISRGSYTVQAAGISGHGRSSVTSPPRKTPTQDAL